MGLDILLAIIHHTEAYLAAREQINQKLSHAADKTQNHWGKFHMIKLNSDLLPLFQRFFFGIFGHAAIPQLIARLTLILFFLIVFPIATRCPIPGKNRLELNTLRFFLILFCNKQFSTWKPNVGKYLHSYIFRKVINFAAYFITGCDGSGHSTGKFLSHRR